ncbi:MAG: hypothetical protein DCO96_02745 [Fluviicola sp. XM-24bin1]|nr:MAG: hypothetical protein DCO96_02745 [Fluviicola sp. XM-24bin1]
MKAIVSCIALICAIATVRAQVRISFVDELEDPIVGVKTQFFHSNGTLILKSVSDENGVVLIPSEKAHKSSVIRINAVMFGFEHLDTVVQVASNLRFALESDIAVQDEVIVTAQYGTNTVENSVHRIKVIDREKMDAMGAVNLRDVLTNEMGVRLAQDNVLGSSMSLQGISGENVKILIDGVPVVGRLDGNIDLSQINLNEIERIEIVEGPLSVNYGTNALAGVINLITKKPTRNQISSGAGSYCESIGHYNANVDVDFGNKNHSYGFSVGRNFFDGWDPTHATFRNPIPVADERRSILWNPKEQMFGSAYYQFVKSKWNIRYKFDFFDEYVLNRGLPRQPYFNTAFDDEYNTRRVDNSVNVKRRLGTNGKWNSMFSYSRYDRVKNTFFVDLTNLERQLTASELDQDTSMFDQWVFRGSYAHSKDSSIISYQFGYDIMLESATGRRILNRRRQQGDFALFTIAEIRPLQKMVIRPGLRYSYNTAYNAPLLPSLNIKWTLAKNIDWRASYARGFRAPGIKELYFEFVDINHNIVGNDNLNAESSHNLSSAFLHRFKSEKWSLKSELLGFYNTISNRISLAAVDATQFSYVNIGSFQSTGIRASFQFRRDQLSVNAAIGWIGTASDVFSDALRNEFLFSREVQGSLMYGIQKTKTSLGIFYKYQGQLPQFILDDDGNVAQGFTADFHTLDFSVTQKFWNESFHLTLGVKNLFDITNVATNVGTGGVHSSGANAIAIGTGRSYFTSLQYRFKHKKKLKK